MVRVFLVDDDPLSCQAIGLVLEREGGFEVLRFTSSRDAVAAAEEAAPDAVICGLRLTGGSGPALLAEFEAMDPLLASLLLTSYADSEATTEAIARVGPLRCVGKPVNAADLLPKLAVQLELRSRACEIHAMGATLQQRDRALSASRRETERAAAELHATSIELETATERLVRSEQAAAVGRVLGGISHELDRQLALIGYAEAIKARVADDAELVELADIIVTAQTRLVAMVSEIREFVSTGLDQRDANAGPIAREPADVAAIVAEALHIMRFDPDARTRVIEHRVAVKPLAALHREKFCQVILNLVSNAVLATEPRDLITVVLDVDGHAPNQQVVITVSDGGEGMSPEVLRRLGEPFFTTRGERGSGLGVGICKRIVAEHGGVLTFESELGVGTTACVRLPLLGDSSGAAIVGGSRS